MEIEKKVSLLPAATYTVKPKTVFNGARSGMSTSQPHKQVSFWSDRGEFFKRFMRTLKSIQTSAGDPAASLAVITNLRNISKALQKQKRQILL